MSLLRSKSDGRQSENAAPCPIVGIGGLVFTFVDVTLVKTPEARPSRAGKGKR